jgi:hemerythrin-like domain-containing protein
MTLLLMLVKAVNATGTDNQAVIMKGQVMDTIRGLLGDHHRQCDELFAAIEQAIETGAWDRAADGFSRFDKSMRQHFDVEESILFPAFEARTGMTMGPTAVMRSEHAQIRELLEAAAEAIVAHDADEYSGYAETLHIMTQQHNMKEENVLYPMCDQHLGAQSSSLVTQMRDGIAG